MNEDNASFLHSIPSEERWTLFLDRDGVINRRKPDDYVKRWEEFEFLPGVPEAIASLGTRFARIIVVTNQQGIGKGLMTHADADLIHDRMRSAVARAGGEIHGVYVAPHLSHEDPGLRKPALGMAHAAARDFPDIAFARALMVGDSATDLAFGRAAGMRTILIGTLSELPIEEQQLADAAFDSLASLAGYLERGA